MEGKPSVDSKRKQNEFLVEHVKGSGPGGQHKNKRLTGVRVTHLPTGIRVTATERRSQKQNLQIAFERLDEKIQKFLFVPRSRIPTRKGRSSIENRLSTKRHRSNLKRLRVRSMVED